MFRIMTLTIDDLPTGILWTVISATMYAQMVSGISWWGKKAAEFMLQAFEKPAICIADI